MRPLVNDLRNGVATLLVRLLIALIGLAPMTDLIAADRPLVIAHRGASGYLPEHTLAAKAAAHAMGADFIEQDVVLTKDDIPVVLHDIHLDGVTNVADIFPNRYRNDGRFYALDFTLAEIRQLRVHERRDQETGKRVFPKRFPATGSTFFVPTLLEEIELIQGMNASRGMQTGIYPEIKQPRWHRDEGHDISPIVIKVLAEYGYRKATDACFLQCFDKAETKRLREELNCELRLVQLLEDEPISKAELEAIADYATGIGPPLEMLVEAGSRPAVASEFAKSVQDLGVELHPYTLRADSLPDFAISFEELHRIVFGECGATGAFTDFPDKTLRLLPR